MGDLKLPIKPSAISLHTAKLSVFLIKLEFIQIRAVAQANALLWPKIGHLFSGWSSLFKRSARFERRSQGRGSTFMVCA
jgi:hypothetical protein